MPSNITSIANDMPPLKNQEGYDRELSKARNHAGASLTKRSHVPVTCENQLRPLHCVAQKYAWGRYGSKSMVARMKAAQATQEKNSDFVVDESLPYAELWLGTHPNGMSTITVNDDVENLSDPSMSQQTLLDYLKSNPELHCGSQQQTDLTFLFKVLSINKVLSVQAHPDKKLAERLHASSPEAYKDPNHKPEMAIALSDKIQAMIGFRPMLEIIYHFEAYPEFRALLGEDFADEIVERGYSAETRDVLQLMFKAFFECPEERVQEQLSCLLDRLKSMDQVDELQQLILLLSEQFPGDSGIMAPLMFNVVTCERGEALFIGANEPHAYISGDLLECMACSDNVVRAALTPKFKDKGTLLDMLTYKSQRPELHLGRKVDECTIRYEPPVADFCVEIIDVPEGKTYELMDLESPSMLLTLAGSAILRQEHVCFMDVTFGSAAFCSAKTRTTIVAGPEGVRLTRAFTNVFHDDYQQSKALEL